jgi:hypothetical protein
MAGRTDVPDAAGLIVRVSTALPVPAQLVAETLMANVPDATGVPEINPE